MFYFSVMFIRYPGQLKCKISMILTIFCIMKIFYSAPIYLQIVEGKWLPMFAQVSW